MRTVNMWIILLGIAYIQTTNGSEHFALVQMAQWECWNVFPSRHFHLDRYCHLPILFVFDCWFLWLFIKNLCPIVMYGCLLKFVAGAGLAMALHCGNISCSGDQLYFKKFLAWRGAVYTLVQDELLSMLCSFCMSMVVGGLLWYWVLNVWHNLRIQKSWYVGKVIL